MHFKLFSSNQKLSQEFMSASIKLENHIKQPSHEQHLEEQESTYPENSLQNLALVVLAQPGNYLPWPLLSSMFCFLEKSLIIVHFQKDLSNQSLKAVMMIFYHYAKDSRLIFACPLKKKLGKKLPKEETFQNGFAKKNEHAWQRLYYIF